jgi:hypothetical protein
MTMMAKVFLVLCVSSFRDKQFTDKLIDMDFLDPVAKKRRNIRLMVGYVLTGILIITASTIMVFQAYGFEVDRKTGEVIQNGLVFIDSAPDGATIYLNGEVQRELTNTRLKLVEGKYELLIKKDGYRDWKRAFDLHGGDIERFTYPMLLPLNLEQQEIANLGASVGFSSQSPDRRWLMVSKGAAIREFIEYDLNNVDQNTEKPRERAFTFPEALFKKIDGPHSIELVEWSTDNKHMLVKHNFTGGYEFLVLSRDNPETSININQLLGINPTAINLRDKKFDQWYLYTQDGGVLQAADSKKNIAVVLTGVGTFKSHDDKTLLYTQPILNAKTQRVFLRQDDRTYLLREISAGPAQLDIARYDNAWYLLVGSDADQKTYVYKDPARILALNDERKPAPVSILKSTGALTWVSFSNNTRFTLAQSGQHIEVYDAEYKETFRYDIGDLFDSGTKLKWMDGHRLIARSKNEVIIFDFDGSNFQKVVPAVAGDVIFFDRDYTVLYALNKSKVTTDTLGLIRTDLRFEQDK